MRTTKIKIGLQLLAALILLASAAADGEDGWKRFACPAEKFSLDLPSGWRQLEKIPDLTFAAAGPQEGPGDTFIENLTIATAPNSPPRTIDDLFELYLRQLPPVADGYQFVAQSELRVDGRAGRRLVFRQKLEGETVEVMQVLFIKGDKIYFLTFTDCPESFKLREADFERAALSLKFD